jgi:hypothetical protein
MWEQLNVHAAALGSCNLFLSLNVPAAAALLLLLTCAAVVWLPLLKS